MTEFTFDPDLPMAAPPVTKPIPLEGTMAVDPPPGAVANVEQSTHLATYSGPDYNPSPVMEKQIKKEATRELRHPSTKALDTMTDTEIHVEVTEDRDYLTPKETEEKRLARETLTMEVAKRIFQSYEVQNKRYKNARKLVNDATTEARENPSADLKKYLRIVAKGKPMTKKLAIEQARQQVLTSRSV